MNKAALGLALAGGAVGLFMVSRSASASESTDGPSFAVQAGDRNYVVKFVKEFDTESGKQTFWDIFDVQGNRIARYSQLEDDQTSRVFIVSPLPANSPILHQALNDFGIAFLGGVVEDDQVVLASDVKTLPGQLLVVPGEYLATVDVGFPKSLVVSAPLISEALKAQGFRQVAVFTSAPADWPISKDGDYFVQAVWSGDARLFSLPPEVVDIRSRGLV